MYNKLTKVKIKRFFKEVQFSLFNNSSFKYDREIDIKTLIYYLLLQQQKMYFNLSTNIDGLQLHQQSAKRIELFLLQCDFVKKHIIIIIIIIIIYIY